MKLEGEELVDGVARGDVRAVARAITLVERGGAMATRLADQLYPKGGRALVVGVTGPAGSGKSTLVDRLIAAARADGLTVGVLAVDPTSPFTGGALLGDRLRMATHAADDGVFIRSMATRGQLGGLAAATADAAAVLDASGRDVVFVETVGVGQDEVDVVRLASVTVLVLVPGTGDDVQALKAGVMEIADVFVVNKADREGADRAMEAVAAALALSPDPGGWRPPVLKTQASTGEGVDALWAAVAQAHAHQQTSAQSRAMARAAAALRAALAAEATRGVDERVAPADWADAVSAVAGRRASPSSTAARLLGLAFAADGDHGR